MIILGQTTCPICKMIILDNDYELFPPFVSNEKDSLFIINDAAVHIDCLNASSIKDLALEFRDQYYEFLQKFRFIYSDPQSKPQNAILFGLLTSVKSEPMSKFNFSNY